ncbi:MAG: type II toxin-antitoxin system VapC family toxin [Armatimonadota bacterium]|nr:type II toxin-antitoxin system VapC family toxin [Armatimonadota bacterium]
MSTVRDVSRSPVPQGKVVLDASAAIAFALETEASHRHAVRLIADLDAQCVRLIAPPLFESEADSTIRRLVYSKSLDIQAGADAQVILNSLPMEIVYDAEVRPLARQIAERFNLVRVYDATYAALAQRRNCDLWTADERFFNSVRAGLPFVRFLGTYSESV